MSALTKWLDDLDAKAERPCHGDACAPSGECSACIDTQDAAVNAAPILSRIVRAAVASREAARKYHDAILNGDDSEALYAPYMDAEVAMFAAIDRAEAEAAR